MVIIFMKKIEIVFLKEIKLVKIHINKTKSNNKKGIRLDYCILKAE